MAKDQEPQTVVAGWCEYVDLPEWGVTRLKAKLDTGARSSSLHVENLKKLTRGRVAFDVVLSRQRNGKRVHVVAQVVRRSQVRSTTGEAQDRYFVKTALRLGGVGRQIEVNLVSRGDMRFRMLLGRTALGGLIIDPARRYPLTRQKHQAKKAKPK